ncbi:hypothetical protein Hanom_Chr10g00902621 [Helianthus anomalus]
MTFQKANKSISCFKKLTQTCPRFPIRSWRVDGHMKQLRCDHRVSNSDMFCFGILLYI